MFDSHYYKIIHFPFKQKAEVIHNFFFVFATNKQMLQVLNVVRGTREQIHTTSFCLCSPLCVKGMCTGLAGSSSNVCHKQISV